MPDLPVMRTTGIEETGKLCILIAALGYCCYAHQGVRAMKACLSVLCRLKELVSCESSAVRTLKLMSRSRVETERGDIFFVTATCFLQFLFLYQKQS